MDRAVESRRIRPVALAALDEAWGDLSSLCCALPIQAILSSVWKDATPQCSWAAVYLCVFSLCRVLQLSSSLSPPLRLAMPPKRQAASKRKADAVDDAAALLHPKPPRVARRSWDRKEK